MNFPNVPLFLLICLIGSQVLKSPDVASWYGEDHRGKPMANGRLFNPDLLTCASWNYPFGTLLKVTYKSKSVVVEVTDRGPNKRLKRAIDLSSAAFNKLAPLDTGLINVKIEKLK